MNSFNNTRHVPIFLQDVVLVGVTHTNTDYFCRWFIKISLMSFRLQMPFGGKHCGRRYKRKNAQANNIGISKTNFLPVKISTGTLLLANVQEPASENAFP